MRIAIDYDDTYTLAPDEWDHVILLFKVWGHDIRCVTARSSTEDRTEALVQLERRIPVIYCNGVAKESVCRFLGWEPQVWVDDKPRSVIEDSPTTEEQLATWRATRNEGPVFPKEIVS